jgi:16S rRNA G966 N2-methylase RsmD
LELSSAGFYPNINRNTAQLEKNLKQTIEALASGPATQYILDHEHDDVSKIMLKHKEILGLPAARLLEQIVTRRKAKDKLPLYYHTPGIIFPPPENFEQSSSEATAIYKSEILNNLIPDENRTGVDLTGGFGVDAYFLSKRSSKLHVVEPDAMLVETARHDHALLGAHNIEYHTVTAAAFLETHRDHHDFIYIDPSRRTQAKKKIHAFEASQPDVVKLADEIFQRTTCLLVKASPLLDLQAGVSALPFVRNVFVISVHNECKEILFHSEKGYSGEPVVQAVNLSGTHKARVFEFTFSEERQHAISLADPMKYLYEPNASILKAGAFKSIAVRYGLKKIHASTHLYTSDELIETFPGRLFIIEALIRPSPADIRQSFPEMKANVTTRNYPLTPEALKKKTGLKDGGEKFLIGFSGPSKKFLAVAKRI